MWRDGMGRLTVKWDTGESARGECVFRDGFFVGVCRAPGWIQTYGVAYIPTNTPPDYWRERLTERARYRRQQRHGPRALRNKGYRPPDMSEDDL